mmetsp:Transcript_48327/g.114569  ORF Transcript_48327/g.114569 Transcript_48327/m.114569 type:complete len:255 (-) Transcript_48327:5160-5924(-)
MPCMRNSCMRLLPKASGSSWAGAIGGVTPASILRSTSSGSSTSRKASEGLSHTPCPAAPGPAPRRSRWAMGTLGSSEKATSPVALAGCLGSSGRCLRMNKYSAPRHSAIKHTPPTEAPTMTGTHESLPSSSGGGVMGAVLGGAKSCALTPTSCTSTPGSAAWSRLLSVAVSTPLAMVVASESEDASASASIVDTSRRRLEMSLMDMRRALMPKTSVRTARIVAPISVVTAEGSMLKMMVVRTVAARLTWKVLEV